MGKEFDRIDDALKAWVENQRLFFVGTAPLTAEGHINDSLPAVDVDALPERSANP